MQLILIDLETSGLEPRENVICEIAVRVVDAENPQRILERCSYVVRHSLAVFDNAHPAVMDMHTTNGLIKDMRKLTAVELHEVESLILGMLDRCPPDRENYRVFAGNSIGALDVPMIKQHMPRLAAAVSYRMIDLTCIATALEAFGLPLPKVLTARVTEPGQAHRADADVDHSLLQWCALARFFAPLALALGNASEIPERFDLHSLRARMFDCDLDHEKAAQWRARNGGRGDLLAIAV